MGTALGISALPVIAKILSDLDLMRRNVAQVLLAAAMADDIAGWVLLGMVAGLAQSGSVDAARLAITVAGLAVFLGLAFTVGQRAVDALLRTVRVRRWGAPGSLTAVLLVALASGATTHALGLEAVFGAFIAGIVLGRSRFHDTEVFDSDRRRHALVLRAALLRHRRPARRPRPAARPEVLGWGVIVVAVASASKGVGAYLGSRLAGLPAREGLALGAGLNARGAVEIVVATVGLSLGVLNPSSYALVVLLAVDHLDDGAAAAALRCCATGAAPRRSRRGSRASASSAATCSCATRACCCRATAGRTRCSPRASSISRGPRAPR